MQLSTTVFVAVIALARSTAAAAITTTTNSTSTSTESPTNVVTMFINDEFGGDVGYAGSVVTACPSLTVYALQCTSGPAYVGASTCGPNAVTQLITAGPSVYIGSLTTETTVQGTAVSLGGVESCNLKGTTEADCTASVVVSLEGTASTTITSTIIDGTDYHRFGVSITGGADKLVSPTGACPALSAITGSSGSSSGGSASKSAAPASTQPHIALALTFAFAAGFARILL